jgi:hypothetical protein
MRPEIRVPGLPVRSSKWLSLQFSQVYSVGIAIAGRGGSGNAIDADVPLNNRKLLLTFDLIYDAR